MLSKCRRFQISAPIILFGLRTDANLVVRYDACEKRIDSVSGVDVDHTDIEPAEVFSCKSTC